MRILPLILCLVLAGGPTPGYAASQEQNREAQELLTELGYDPGPIDGLIGAKTRAAVRKAQEHFGVTPTGEISADLLEKLKHEGENGKRLLGAAKTGDLDTLNELLAEGVDLEAKGLDGLTALHTAIWNKQRPFAHALISSGADIRAKTRNGGFEPLHNAVQRNDYSTTDALLAAGADVNATADSWGPA